MVAPMVVSFGNFSYGDKEIGCAFSRYLEEKLGKLLLESELFELFDKRELEAILEEIEFSLSDLVDPSTSIEVGRLKGIQALVSGRFFEEATDLRIFLELTDIETGVLLSKEELLVPRGLIPPSVSIRPDNYNDALYLLEELAEVHGANSQDFVVKIWITRGNGATYRKGEKLVINFFANKDCYIRVFQIDVNKRTQLIFPNPFFSDNFIRGEKIYKIPDSHYPFEFVLSEPLGTEFVKVIASTVQFKNEEEAFEDIGEASGSIITRGLNIAQKEEQITEAMITYTIVE